MFDRRTSFTALCVLFLWTIISPDSISTQSIPSVSTKSPIHPTNTTSHVFLSTFSIVNTTTTTTTTTQQHRTNSATPTPMMTKTPAKPRSSAVIRNHTKSSSLSPLSAQALVDQFNYFRHNDIITRVKQCSSTMKLHDICEIYYIDNRTNQLKRSSIVEFQSLGHATDSLVDRMAVEKLRKVCSIGHWCLGNLSGDSILFTLNVIRQYGHAFCELERCDHRLQIYLKSCASNVNHNNSIATLKLLPMICSLYQEQDNWNQNECMQGIVYFLHLLYAFWPQFEFCSQQMNKNSGGCSHDCQALHDLLRQVENQCHDYNTFLTQIPVFSWYQSVNLRENCHEKSISLRPAFMASVQTFFTENTVWDRFHQKPVYAAFVVLIVLSLAITVSLFCYLKSKRTRRSTSNRRPADDYEYTRLHNTSFEFGTSTEIPNVNLSAPRMMDESQLETDDQLSFPEYQRLLHLRH